MDKVQNVKNMKELVNNYLKKQNSKESKYLQKVSNNKTYTFSADFLKVTLQHTSINAYPILLLSDLACNPHFWLDYVWCRYDSALLLLGELKVGDRISFKAKLKQEDIGLKYPVNTNANYLLTNCSNAHQLRPIFSPRLVMPNRRPQELIGYIEKQNHLPVNNNIRAYDNWYNHLSNKTKVVKGISQDAKIVEE